MPALRPRDIADLRLLAGVIPVSIVVGMVYGAAVNESVGQGLMRGGVTGAMIGATLTSIELFYARRPVGQWLVRQPFTLFVLIKTLAYGLAIVALLELSNLLFEGTISRPPLPVLARDVAFSLIVSFGIILFVEIDRLLGGGVFLRLLAGRYHKPQVEQRIFLFADLIGSTALTEELGDLTFHALLNQVFFDLVDPIVSHGGEIYRYVGDEVIVTWPEADGLREGRCLASAQAIRETLARLAPRYRARYGVEPKVRVVLHAGPVVTGEMGDLKREIVFLGDTVNTTARLEAAAKEADRDFVISGSLLEKLSLPDGLVPRPLGERALKGKSQPLAVFALSPAE